VVADAPVLARPDLALGMSLVAGRDGLKATLGNETTYVTPDDLLSRQAYDHGLNIPALSLALGADVKAVATLLAKRVHTTIARIFERVSLRRVRFERHLPTDRARITGETLTKEHVRQAIVAGAQYLARGVSPDGHFRYAVNAPLDLDVPGYDWARHAG